MLDALFGGIASFVVRVLPKVLDSVARTVLTELKGSPSAPWLPAKVVAGIDKIIGRLKEIDQEICNRERYAARSGRIGEAENARIRELEHQKEEEYATLEQAKKQKAAQELAANPSKFVESPLSNQSSHLLQYHLGLAVLEKRCACGYPMRLQHKTVEDPSFTDFFWQCTRFYVEDNRPKCRGIPFVASDIKLLHNSDIPELQIAKQDLLVVGTEKGIQDDTDTRMRDHLGFEDDDVLCPVHSVPMVLYEKQAGLRVPLLDRYHLRCSHFSCTQKTKLKSVPQLAAFLRRKEGVGIVH